MSITWEIFERCIRDIMKLSTDLHDQWNMHVFGDEYSAYLSKKKYMENMVIEYHVAFSLSYSAPLLCLNAYYLNGARLTMEECWKRMNFLESEDMYTTLTQMDHPVLLIPYLTLHPCKTPDLLETFRDSRNPVVSWLSAVGPSVGLDLDLDYVKLTIND